MITEKKQLKKNDAYMFSLKAIKVTMQEDIIKFLDNFQSELFSDVYTSIYKQNNDTLICENLQKDLVKIIVNNNSVDLYSLKNNNKEIIHMHSFNTEDEMKIVNIFELINKTCKKNVIKKSTNLQIIYSKNNNLLLKYYKVNSKFYPNKILYSKKDIKNSQYETTMRYSSSGNIEKVEKVLNHGNVYESFTEINANVDDKSYQYIK